MVAGGRYRTPSGDFRLDSTDLRLHLDKKRPRVLRGRVTWQVVSLEIILQTVRIVKVVVMVVVMVAGVVVVVGGGGVVAIVEVVV